MKKSEMREKYLKLRSKLTAAEVAEKSRKIQNTFLASEIYKNAKTVMLYMDCRNEVETDAVMRQLLRDGKTAVVPVCNTEACEIIPCVINSPEELAAGSYGIKEPKCHREISAEELDVVLVPAVVFDKEGYRVGYGKGYYDRFLTRVRKNCKKVGLAYSVTVCDKIPRDKLDLAVDMIITED